MQTQAAQGKKSGAVVAQTASKEVGSPVQQVTDWDLDSTDSRDMIVPKLLVGQSMSPMVQEGKIKAGDIYNSVSGKVLGSVDEKTYKSVKFIPFKEEVIWVLEESVQGRFKYRGSEARTPDTENLDLEFQKDGKQWRRNRALRYHILLVDELTQAVPFPCALTFMRTSFTAGKALHNHFVLTKAAMQKGHNTNPAAVTFEFGGKKTTNEKGTFYVYNVTTAGETKPEHQKIAFEWLKTMKTTSYKIDNADEEVVVDSAPTSVNKSAEF